MANLLLDLVNYIIAQGLATTGGQDILYNDMPDSPNNLISLLEYAGQSSPISDFGLRSIQPNIRNESDDEARVKAWALYNLFHPNDIEDSIIFLTATRWTKISCRNEPFKLKEDESHRTIYVFNMGVLTHKDS